MPESVLRAAAQAAERQAVNRSAATVARADGGMPY
jgi:hypothetical protein